MEVECTTSGRFQHVEFTPSTGSTNADLAARATRDPVVPLVLCTDEQTTGRGRRDRRWHMAPGGGLLVSFFVPWSGRHNAHTIPTSLGIAAVDAMAVVGRNVGLKWPNDVVSLDGKKLGGMLSEAVLVDGEVVGVVAGLGCNVSWPPQGMEGLESAANLDDLGEGVVDRGELLAALVRGLELELADVESKGVAALHDRYRSRSVTIGTRVRVEQGDNMIVGDATDIDQDGSLILSVNGVLQRVDVGDVVHLRPVDHPAD